MTNASNHATGAAGRAEKSDGSAAPLTFANANAYACDLDDKVGRASAALNRFPKGGMGLTPDAVKTSAAFRAAKREYDEAFAELRRFNAWFVPTFALDIRAERERVRVERLHLGALVWRVGRLESFENCAARIVWADGVNAVAQFGAAFLPWTTTGREPDGSRQFVNAAEARDLPETEFPTLAEARAVFDILAAPES